MIIQEWQIFLDELFEQVVRHYLQTCQEDKLPHQALDLNDIDPVSLVRMRKSVSLAARKKFSLHPYDDRLGRIRRIFGLEPEDGGPLIMVQRHAVIDWEGAGASSDEQ